MNPRICSWITRPTKSSISLDLVNLYSHETGQSRRNCSCCVFPFLGRLSLYRAFIRLGLAGRQSVSLGHATIINAQTSDRHDAQSRQKRASCTLLCTCPAPCGLRPKYFERKSIRRKQTQCLNSAELYTTDFTPLCEASEAQSLQLAKQWDGMKDSPGVVIWPQLGSRACHCQRQPTYIRTYIHRYICIYNM